jgi:hypothetical protein
MAKITTSAGLNVGTELIVHLGYPSTTIELVATGNLVAKDGVTMQALYTKLIKLWTDSAYNAYPFPLTARDNRSGQWSFGVDASGYYNGSGPHNTATRNYLRDAGWNEYDAAGVLQKVYVGIKSFGTLAQPATQPYYLLSAGGTPVNFTYSGVPNEAIKVYDLGATFDQRTYLKIFAREYGYTYDSQDLAGISESVSGAFSLTMNLDNAVDLNIVDNDATVAGSAPYTGITATWIVGNGFTNAAVGSLAVSDVRKDTAGRWFICTGAGTINAAGVANYGANGGTATLAAFSGERDVNGTYYAYNVIVAGNAAPLQKIYTKLRYLLRQAGDIDSGAGTKIGKITDALTQFVGSQLETAPGVYVDNFAGDQTKVTHTDVLGVGHALPLITNQTVTITGGVAGTRIQVKDLTSGTVLYNGTPTFPYTWTDPSPYVADRQIRVRAAYVSGVTAKAFIDTVIGTATALQYALTYALPQVDDAVYNANAIDGSTVTNVTVNDGTLRIELGAHRSIQQIYAAAAYHLFTSSGIAGPGQAIEPVDRTTYVVDGYLFLNVTSGPASAIRISDGWAYDSVTGEPDTLQDMSGPPIFGAPPHVVGFEYAAGGGGLGPDDIDDIAAATADKVWDEPLAGHTTAGTAGKTVADSGVTVDVTQAKVDEL